RDDSYWVLLPLNRDAGLKCLPYVRKDECVAIAKMFQRSRAWADKSHSNLPPISSRSASQQAGKRQARGSRSRSLNQLPSFSIHRPLRPPFRIGPRSLPHGSSRKSSSDQFFHSAMGFFRRLSTR